MEKSNAAKALLGAAALLGATTATPALAESDPLRVGIIDTLADSVIMNGKNVSFEHQSFLDEGQKPGSAKSYAGLQHGVIVASSFVDQSKAIDKNRPIRIYSAGAFYEDTEAQRYGDGNRPMKLNYKAAEKALEWFHKNGVKTVVTAFYGHDNPQMRAFVDKAKELGMLLFAGTNNQKTNILPFPARDPYAIAVTGTNANLDFSQNMSMRSWTAFKTTGDIPSNDMEPSTENGSSFAVARAAAFGAHYALRRPAADREEVVGAMRSSASRDPSGVYDLNDKSVSTRFVKILTGLEATPPARTPMKPGALAMNMAAGSMGR